MLYDGPRPGVATPWFSVISVACGAGGKSYPQNFVVLINNMVSFPQPSGVGKCAGGDGAKLKA